MSDGACAVVQGPELLSPQLVTEDLRVLGKSRATAGAPVPEPFVWAHRGVLRGGAVVSPWAWVSA